MNFIKISLLVCLWILNPLRAYSSLIVTNLSCEYKQSPLGVDTSNPALSWKLSSNQRNCRQIAYQILVSDSKESLQSDNGNIWDSGKINSSTSIQVKYTGPTLISAKTYFWKVRIWDNKSNSSDWSKVASWQMGLLNASDWKKAKWIAYEDMPESEKVVPAIHLRSKLIEKNNILPLLRKSFNVKSNLKQATIFISGLGHFDLSLNGQKVGDHFLNPGWTKYDKHALYVAFNLTNHLKKGANALGVVLGNGFYFTPRDIRYRKFTSAFGYPKLICRLILEYRDGTTENIISDENWKTSPSPITYSSIYGGEDYNANFEQKDWDTAVFNDENWKNAIVVKGSPELNAQTAEPLKTLESFSPVKITQVKEGVWVYDMGQNASAIPYISVCGKKGSVVRITPGELLNKDGTVNQTASGSPHYYEYTLKGIGSEIWQPRFTYYGFRYIEIEGALPEKEANPHSFPVLIKVKSLHVRNAAERAGTFVSSNDLFNKTNTLIDWAIKSNMMSVLTDCPHREKLGWLEEAHLVGSSVQYNYNIASLGKKIVKDMIAAQTTEGLIPSIAPEYPQFDGGFRDSPEWGSNGIIFPWYLYKWYGDKDILKESYPMMQKYVDYLASKADAHILSHGLGDWFDIGPKKHPGEAQLTPKSFTATAIYYYDLDLLSKIAELLGKKEDVKRYQEWAMSVKRAFNSKFFNSETKQYSTGSQTANAMAIYLKLVAPENKQAVIDNLVKEIKSKNNALTAGDIGYRYVLRALDEAGRSDVIYEMNSRSDVPGYGWQLAHGATALTESWQAYGFVSNNHFMLGHLMEWFYSGLGGIQQAEDAVAYDKLLIRPQVVGDVSSASSTYESPYGKISSVWKKKPSHFELEVTVPANSTAKVFIPVTISSSISESGKDISKVKDIKFLGISDGIATVEVGSGHYKFVVNKTN